MSWLQIPAASFQAIFDKALSDYQEQIGVELDKHPFADEIRSRDTPDEVLKLLEDRANIFKEYRDGNRKLITWLNPVVQVILKLAGVPGDSEAVRFQLAKAIFVGVDVLITAADGVSSSYGALVDLFECIGNFLKRLQIYTDTPSTPAVMDITVQIMVELLSVFALATKQIKQGRFKKFAKKLLGDSEIEAVLQRLDRLTQEEGRITVAQTLEVVHGLMNNVKVVMNDGKASTGGIRKSLDTMQQIASEMNKMNRYQLQKDSKNWLCPPDPSKNYNIGCQINQDGTASWFFQGNIFTEWNTKSSLLWIYGKPGSGKSTLLSSIIREINSLCMAGLATMAYFYFDFREPEKQHYRGLFSSLVFQLSAKSDPCYQILSCLYSDHAGGNREPSEGALSQCLVDMLKVPGQPATYLIIDALDECPNISGIPTARERVLMFLKRLVKLNLPSVHICVSSRLEVDIRNALEPLALFRMCLHEEISQKMVISDYVNSLVCSDEDMGRWRDEDRKLVVQELSERADGMFQWVFCQLETLRREVQPDILAILKQSPRALNETYERVLKHISENNRKHACRLFQCLAVSVRPLLVEELAEILAFDFDTAKGDIPIFSPDRRPNDQEGTILSICSSLVTIVDNGGSRVVQFCHLSFREFLTSKYLASSRGDLSLFHIFPERAHTILAQICLGFLLHLGNFDDNKNAKGFPLAEYAARHWVTHAQFEDVASHVMDGIKTLFDPDRPHFASWIGLFDIAAESGRRLPLEAPNPSYYSALCGFPDIFSHTPTPTFAHVRLGSSDVGEQSPVRNATEATQPVIPILRDSPKLTVGARQPTVFLGASRISSHPRFPVTYPEHGSSYELDGDGTDMFASTRWKLSKHRRPIPVERTDGHIISHSAIGGAFGTAARIGHEALSAGVDILQFAPVPGLQLAGNLLLNIWDAVGMVKTNRVASMRLTERCEEILISIRDEIAETGDTLTEELRAPIAKLVKAFKGVHDLLNKLGQRPFLKRYLGRNDIQASISACDTSLSDALGMFRLSIQIRTLNLIQANELQRQKEKPDLLESPSHLSPSVPPVDFPLLPAVLQSSSPTDPESVRKTMNTMRVAQNAQDRVCDAADLRQLMRTALDANDDLAMFEIFQIARSEMPEAIKTLERALECVVEGGQLDAEECTTMLHSPHWDEAGSCSDLSVDPATKGANQCGADTLDREFIETGIDALRRLSKGTDLGLPSWTITRFEIDLEAKVGVGFFSDVYRGTWRRRTVAVKLLAETTPRKIFLREVEILKSLYHPNVLELYGASSASGEPPWFLVSKYYPKGSLVKYLKGLSETDVASVDALKMMHEISDGMAYFTSRAANILVDDDTCCVISDFGQSEMKSEVYRVTRVFYPRGTLRWQAPELMEGAQMLTPEMDVYAFAICCWEILAMGALPWMFMDDDAVRHLVLNNNLRPSLLPFSLVSSQLMDIIHASWDRVPSNRPSFEQIANDLKKQRTVRTAQAEEGCSPLDYQYKLTKS